MIVLTTAELEALLPMETAIDIVADTMKIVSAGGATMPLRTITPLGDGNALGIMPGALAAGFGTKLVCLFPGNPAKGLSSHTGLAALFDPDDGTARALMNADRLTAIRTAAASAVATRALARADATRLAIIGTGEEARTHLDAMRAVRPIREIVIAGRTPARAAEFAAEMGAAHAELAITAAGSVAEACASADIVCAVTSAKTPILSAADIAPGAHVNAVGASMPMVQEIDADLHLAAETFTDYRPSALAQAADVIALTETGHAPEAVIQAEIGEVLAGDHPGRSGAEAITLYRSLGVIAQDLACAIHVAGAAEAAGAGTRVEI